jgi:multicomponent K+:H+ antiporter subunit E
MIGLGPNMLLPHPLLSLTILAIWFLLWDGFSLGLLALGLVISVALPLFTRRFWPDAPEVRSYWKLAEYLVVFGYDILVANLNVAWLIVQPNSTLKPTFLEIPLDIEHPFLITVLANTISLTPGTVSSNVTGDRGMLLVHCFHCEEPDEQIDTIKARYEDRLEEIFA